MKKYIGKVIDRFCMVGATVVSTPFARHFRLAFGLCPRTQEDLEFMKDIPYFSMVGSIMYAIVCTHPHIYHGVGVVGRFMSNPRKPH